MKKSLLFALVLGALLPSVPTFGQLGGGGGQFRLDIVISEVQPHSLDESVTIENKNPFPIDLTGWTLEAGSISQTDAHRFAFPAGCTLPPGASVSLHFGLANLFRDSATCGQPQFDLVWSVWFTLADQAGVVTLKDPNGKVIAAYEYPNSVSKVVINEVELNPQGAEKGNEWVELYNPSAQAVDVSGWSLGALKGTSVKLNVPLDAVIPAQGFIVVQVGIEFLNDQGEVLELRKPDGSLADRTPEAGLMDLLDDDRCWARAVDAGVGWAFQGCTREGSNAL